eukprot:250297_1
MHRSRVRCCKCKKNKSRHSFSKSQLRKLQNKRSCKACISKHRPQPPQAPQKQVPHSKAPIDQKQNDDPNDTYIQSLRDEAARLEAPGQLSFLQKLHSHCVQKSVFTEIYLGFKISEKDSYAAQAGMERIFKLFPDTFVYHDRVIIASNDEQFQSSIYLGIKQIDHLNVIEAATRLCCAELLYQNGKISRNGVEFYDPCNTTQNSDISLLLSKPKRAHFEANDTHGAKQFVEAKERTESLMQLEQQQKQMKLDMNELKRHWNDKRNQMKRVHESNVLVQWNSIKAKMKKQSDHVLDDDDLDTLKSVLATVLPDITWQMEHSEGQLIDSVLRIDKYHIAIPKSMKNHDFMGKLEDVISHLAQDICGMNDMIDIGGMNEDDSVSALIHACQEEVAQCEKSMVCATRSFHKCSAQITEILQRMVDGFDRSVQTGDSELFNMDFAPTKLVFDLRGQEPLFISHVIQKKQVIMQWMSQRIDRYEGIGEYGVEHLFVRFMNFLITAKTSWWIAILRCLTLPVSVHNLNLVKKYITQSVDGYFRPNHRTLGREIDVVMVVTYFMNIKPAKYQANPLKFTFNDKRNAQLSGATMKTHVDERQIANLCNDCFRYVVNLFPKYKKSTNAKKMNRQIDVYMANNQTKNMTVRRDPTNDNAVIYSNVFK